MKFKVALGLIICSILFSGAVIAETRTYRQVKDVVTKENGNVSQSANKGDLFEYSYVVDMNKKIITRTKIQRQDKSAPQTDATIYKIMQKQELLPSEAGNGGKVLVAVRADGLEILELGHRFAFTMRTSPF